MAMFTKNKKTNDEAENAITAAGAAEDQASADESPADEAPADEVELGEAAATEEVADDAEAAEEAAPTGEPAAEADGQEDEDDDEDDEDGGGDDALDLDLMDIFEAEQNESTSTAGIYSEFLESLTMEEVLDRALILLDEIRTKVGR